MEQNKSSELVNANQIGSEQESAGGREVNPFEQLLDKADQAVRQGQLQESREHLTRIFELLATSPVSRAPAHHDVHFGAHGYRLSQSA